MAPMKQDNLFSSSSNYYGEDVVSSASNHQMEAVDILASCYLVSNYPGAQLKGLHYCATGLTGAECPPLAALDTSTNQLAVTAKANSSTKHGNRRANSSGNSNSNNSRGRRGGATLRIREECERFFCETLRAVLLGEKNLATANSGLAGSVFYNHHNVNNTNNDTPLTPPYDYDYAIGDKHPMSTSQQHGFDDASATATGNGNGGQLSHRVDSWIELWDYVGGASFRGVVTEDMETGEKTLMIFFDEQSVEGRDLKKALVALIELADGPLACSHMVICLDRSIPEEEAVPLMKGLQWAGFSMTTFDFWSGGKVCDVVSGRWLFMGMEM
ncbi:ornithine decarboxylase antizyme-domain-containing protein [Sordaria brevicollis]|uniref:Ornithine decarboxylase antizyme n=1 Tax=Sordaria brevicollis TaxID=83679 RepID=A0AAE0NR62_SORBR|nr:ornithine decarboxylase antizyme-domain-containing protein [Sordaria brevicollis]